MYDPQQQNGVGGTNHSSPMPPPLSLVFRVPGLGRRQREHPQQQRFASSPQLHLERASKRRVGAVEAPSDDTSSASESSSSSSSVPPHTAAVVAEAATVTAPKKKKRWLAERKEERRALEQELRRLQELKQRCEQSPPSRTIAVLTQQQRNEQLRIAILEQQLQLARAQSAITGASATQLRAPFEQHIHLSRDWTDRAATLAELKPGALHSAERYIYERARFLDLGVKYSQTEKRELPTGEVVLTGFHALPLVGFASVREVFSAIRQFYFNMEITYTELSGELMVREGDFDEVSGRSGDPDIKTQRLVRATPAGTQIESNAVLFCGLREALGESGSSDGDTAVIVVDSVDTDELHPHRGGVCVRQDTTAALCVRRWHARGSNSGTVLDSTASSSTPSTGIVLTGAFFARLHCAGAAAVPADAVESMAFGSAFCFKTLVQTISATVRSAAPSQQPPGAWSSSASQ